MIDLATSNGVRILVWREGDMFAARRADAIGEAQVCLGVDLFEVIAELAGLDLDDTDEGEEAVRLAAEAQRRLASWPRAASLD